jgi:hypothetical protein
MRYIRPTSLTWWAGILAIVTGIASAASPADGAIGELARLIAQLTGASDTSPAGLIALGLGLIGLRDRLERGFRGND